jgi:hypothetical protein
MTKIINLRTARKQKVRRVSKAEADANRVEHGRTKTERGASKLEHLRARKSLEGKRLDDPDGAPDKGD